MSATTFYNNQKLVGIGSVGIGTTSPQYILDIAGQPRYSIQPLLQTTSYSVTAGATAGWYRIASFGPTVRAKIRIITSGGNLQEQVTVTATWSAAYSGGPTVRIEDQSSATFAGTCPLLNGQIRTLVYVASNGTWYLEVYLGSVVTAYTFYVYLIEGDASGGSITLTNPIVAGSIPTNYTAYPIPVNSFSVTPWGSSNPAIFVSYTGSVGIGTASPTTNLQVLGTAAVGGQSYTGSPSLYVSNVTTTSNASIGLQTGGGSMFHATAYSSWMGLGGNGATAPTQGVINITNGGNVGIGTTNPSDSLVVAPAQGSNRLLNINNQYNSGGSQSTALIHSDQSFSVGTTAYTGAVLSVTSYPNGVANNNGYNLKVGTSDGSEGTYNVQFCVKTQGNVGIGTASPQQQLDLYASSGGYGYIGNSGGSLFMNCATGNSIILGVNGVSKVYMVGNSLTATTDNTMTLGGGTGQRWVAVYAVNGTIQTSDSKYKDSVPLTYGLNEILQANTILYSWKTQASLPDTDPEKNFKYFGVCADELVDIMPELCYNENPDVAVQINYAELVPVCMNAIKELSAKVAALEQRLAAAGL